MSNCWNNKTLGLGQNNSRVNSLFHFISIHITLESVNCTVNLYTIRQLKL